MTRVLTDFETALGIDLGDVSAATWNNTSKDRAVVRAVADLSRFLPREQITEYAVDVRVEDEDFTTAAAHGTYVSLANKPIAKGTVTVESTDGVTKYVEDSDYTMNYTDGKITTISGGDMVVATGYHISYDKSHVAIDISALSGFIRVTRVEKVGCVPQQYYSNHVTAGVLYLDGLDGESQSDIEDQVHIAVYWDAVQTAPTTSAGSFPEFLDETIRQLAVAYCLFEASIKRATQGATDLASARTALSSATTAHTALGTALTNMKKYLDNNSGSDAVGVLANIAAIHTSITDALTSAKKYLDNNSNADAVGVLVLTTDLAALDTALANATTQFTTNATGRLTAEITTDAASLRTAINTALDALNAYADAVATDISNAAAVNTDVATYNTGASAPSLLKYLTDGDDTVNTINDGGEGNAVALAYAKFAEMSGLIVQNLNEKRKDLLQAGNLHYNGSIAYMQEAAQRLSNLRSYIEEAQTYTAIGQGFVAEAQQIYNKLTISLAQSQQYQGIADEFIKTAAQHMERINSYVAQSEAYTNAVNAFGKEAEERMAEIESYLAQAQRYRETADGEMLIAEKYRQQATDLKQEVYGIWNDRNQYIGNYAEVANRQGAANVR